MKTILSVIGLFVSIISIVVSLSIAYVQSVESNRVNSILLQLGMIQFRSTYEKESQSEAFWGMRLTSENNETNISSDNGVIKVVTPVIVTPFKETIKHGSDEEETFSGEVILFAVPNIGKDGNISLDWEQPKFSWKPHKNEAISEKVKRATEQRLLKLASDQLASAPRR